MIPLSSRDEARLFLQDLESNPEFPLKTRQEASVPLGHSMGSKKYPSQLKESRVLCFHWRRGLTLRVKLECNPEIPVAPGEEHYVLDKSLDEVYFALQ